MSSSKHLWKHKDLICLILLELPGYIEWLTMDPVTTIITVFGAVALFIVIVLVVLTLCKWLLDRRRKRRPNSDEDPLGLDNSGFEQSSSTVPDPTQSQHNGISRHHTETHQSERSTDSPASNLVIPNSPVRDFYTDGRTNAKKPADSSELEPVPKKSKLNGSFGSNDQLPAYVIVLTAWTSKFKTRMNKRLHAKEKWNRIVNVLCEKHLEAIEHFVEKEAKLTKSANSDNSTGQSYGSLQFLVDLDDALHPWANSNYKKVDWAHKLKTLNEKLTYEWKRDIADTPVTWKFLSVKFSEPGDHNKTPVHRNLEDVDGTFRYLIETNVSLVANMLTGVVTRSATTRKLPNRVQPRVDESGYTTQQPSGENTTSATTPPQDRKGSTITKAALTTLQYVDPSGKTVKTFHKRPVDFQTKMFTGLSSWSFPRETIFCSDKELLTVGDYDYAKKPEDSLNWGRVGTAGFGSVVRACARGNRAELYWIQKKSANGYDVRDAMQCYREIYIMRRLRHRNIVNLLHMYRKPIETDTGVSKTGQKSFDDYYLIMDISGKSLESLIAEEKEFTEFAIIRVVCQILNGLAYLHANRVVHGGVVPSNIYISASMVVKLTNLGLHPTVPSIDTTEANGDSQYTSPEVIARWLPTGDRIPQEWRDKGYLGELHHAAPADIWSTAMIASHLLTRKMALNMGNDLQFIEQVVLYFGKPDAEFILCLDPISRQFFNGGGERQGIEKLTYDEYLKTKKPKAPKVSAVELKNYSVYDAMKHYPAKGETLSDSERLDEIYRSVAAQALIKFIDQALYIMPWKRITAAQALTDTDLPFLYDICRCKYWSLYRCDCCPKKDRCIHDEADVAAKRKQVADTIAKYRDNTFKADYNGFNVTVADKRSELIDVWKERIYLEVCDNKDYMNDAKHEMYNDDSVYRCIDPEYVPEKNDMYDSDNSLSYELSSVSTFGMD